jgi:hypothetical protein
MQLREIHSALQGAPRTVTAITTVFEKTTIRIDEIRKAEGKVCQAIMATAAEISDAAVARDQAALTALAGRLSQQTANLAQLGAAYRDALEGATTEAMEKLATVANPALLVASVFPVLSENMSELPTHVVSSLLKAAGGKLQL